MSGSLAQTLGVHFVLSLVCPPNAVHRMLYQATAKGHLGDFQV